MEKEDGLDYATDVRPTYLSDRDDASGEGG